MFNLLPQKKPSSILVSTADIEKKTTKTGKTYHTVTFIARDQTRQTVNFWDGGPPPPEISTIIKLRATWHTGDYGLEAKDISLHQPTAEEIDEFTKCFIRPESTHAKQTIQTFIAEKITDALCQELCKWLWRNHGEEYARAAAARGNHQPYSGGLMEHTAAMLLLAEGIAKASNSNGLQPFYKTPINESIIYTAIIFHDCGKIWENNYTPGGIPCHMPYNRIAEYHGHIAIGYALMIEAYNAITGSENKPATTFAQLPELIHHLCHCILSHHGQIEWGSPIEPKTIEAHIVHTVDNLEAKTWMHANNIHNGETLPHNLHKSRGPIRMTISEQQQPASE